VDYLYSEQTHLDNNKNYLSKASTKVGAFFCLNFVNKRFFGIFINMKKKQITEEQIIELIKMYEKDLISSNNLSIFFNIPKLKVLKILHENNIKVRNAGRLDIGGRKVADKKWRDNNKDYTAKKHKVWSKENREHLKEYHKNWRKENNIKWLETKRIYEKNRKASDPVYKLIGNFRTAIYTVLKENNLNKYGHYFEILGYQPEDLVKHLEAQFKDGMTWENYGEWHVDHKKPISLFKFKNMDDDEFKKCWSLENLQPLWGKENIGKSNRY
jgi:hypothetical protein